MPGLKAIARTQSEPPFKFALLFALVPFVLLGIFAAKKFANEQILTA